MSGDRYLIRDQNGIYFLTFTVVGWLDVFIRKEYKDIIVDSLNYCIANKGLRVHGWCLMTSHIHMICKADEPNQLSEIIRDFKKHTAKTIIDAIKKSNRESRREFLLWYFESEGKKDARISKYKFWKQDNHAIEMEQIEVGVLDQKLTYIHENPVVEGIVENAVNYLYSSARDYAEVKGLVKIDYI